MKAFSTLGGSYINAIVQSPFIVRTAAQDGDEDGAGEAEAAPPAPRAAPKQMRSENPDYRHHASDRWLADAPPIRAWSNGTC